MRPMGLTLSIIFEAQSANYGEGIGNIQMLKKLSRGDGNTYTYISRQALRYNIVNQLQWDSTPIELSGGGEKKVAQFSPAATIERYPEIDLFGYFKTAKSESSLSRPAVVRLSHAVALESYTSDMDFLTNMGLTKRAGLENQNSISQSELHKSFYSYSLTIDLDRVGVEKDAAGNVTTEVSKEERMKRVSSLLSAIQFLYRDIKGRRENLAPVFVVGGIVERKNPYFEGRLKVRKGSLCLDVIKQTISQCGSDESNIMCAIVPDIFANHSEIMKELTPVKMGEIFESLSKKVEAYYQ